MVAFFLPVTNRYLPGLGVGSRGCVAGAINDALYLILPDLFIEKGAVDFRARRASATCIIRLLLTMKKRLMVE